MRVAVTRPQADGERTAQALARARARGAARAADARRADRGRSVRRLERASSITSANALAALADDRRVPNLLKLPVCSRSAQRSAEPRAQRALPTSHSADGDVRDLVALIAARASRRDAAALSRRRGPRGRSGRRTWRARHRGGDARRLSRRHRALSAALIEALRGGRARRGAAFLEAAAPRTTSPARVTPELPSRRSPCACLPVGAGGGAAAQPPAPRASRWRRTPTRPR